MQTTTYLEPQQMRWRHDWKILFHLLMETTRNFYATGKKLNPTPSIPS